MARTWVTISCSGMSCRAGGFQQFQRQLAAGGGVAHIKV
jgi:hypothetical protein